MPPSSIAGVDMSRSSSLSDVPEEVFSTGTGTGRSSPHPSQVYIHPSSLKGSASSLASNITSPTRGPVGPRGPSSLRAPSVASISHQLDSVSPIPQSSPSAYSSSPIAQNQPQKIRSRSPMGSIRDNKSGSLVSPPASAPVGPTATTKEPSPSSPNKETKSKSSRSQQQDQSKGSGSATDTRVKHRPYPHLPTRDAQPAPATLMYWSRAPVYGNTPASGMRAHSVTLIDSIAWIFGGCDERGCWRDIWCFNTETMQWSHPEMYGDVPLPCRAHTATLVDRRLVFFGGGEGPVYRNDVYILDTITRRWQQPKFPEGAKLPPPRRAHTAVLYRNKVYVFGGGNGTQALNDLWTLDVGVSIEKMKWEQVQTRGKKPTARGYHTANLVGNVMVVMGGSDGRECFSDIWCLNLDSLQWSQVRLDVTHRRLSHTATQVGSYLFIWGGHDGTQYTSDLLLFNLVALAFETRSVAGKPPAPRGYHAAVIADSRVFVLGGFNGNEVFDDVHILDLAGAAYLPQVTSFRIDVD